MAYVEASAKMVIGPDPMGDLCHIHFKQLLATASEGLAQGPYVAERVEFKPVTLRMQGTEPTTEPPCPTFQITIMFYVSYFFTN